MLKTIRVKSWRKIGTRISTMVIWAMICNLKLRLSSSIQQAGKEKKCTNSINLADLELCKWAIRFHKYSQILYYVARFGKREREQKKSLKENIKERIIYRYDDFFKSKIWAPMCQFSQRESWIWPGSDSGNVFRKLRPGPTPNPSSGNGKILVKGQSLNFTSQT